MSVEAITWAFSTEAPSTGAKLALVAIANSADEYGIAYPGHKLLAARCDCTRETMSARIKRLEQAGLIVRRERRRKNGSRTSDWIVLAAEAEQRAPMLDCPGSDHPEEIAALARCGDVESSREETSHDKSSREETPGTHVRKPGGPPDPSVEPSETSSPPDPLAGEFEDWLVHHERVTGMAPPREGTKARASVQASYRGRRKEKYTPEDLQLAVDGAWASDFRRQRGYFDHTSVLRPEHIHKLVEGGRRAQAAGKGAPTKGWPAWVAEELGDLDGIAATMAVQTAQMLAGGGHEVTVEKVRAKLGILEEAA